MVAVEAVSASETKAETDNEDEEDSDDNAPSGSIGASSPSSSHVRFVSGGLDPSALGLLLRQADALVNPKPVGETFGFTLIEASAIGLPVVAFDASANRETTAGGLLVPLRPGDDVVRSLARALVDLFLAQGEVGVEEGEGEGNTDEKEGEAEVRDGERRPTPLCDRLSLCSEAAARLAVWNSPGDSYGADLLKAIYRLTRIKDVSRVEDG
jgi:glycosyltransferase involved in cell wall biosynthesis